MSFHTVDTLNLAINAGLSLVVGFVGAQVVPFVVRRTAPGENASFGAFCFMMAALTLNVDIDDQSPRFAAEAGKAIGQLAAMPLIW